MSLDDRMRACMACAELVLNRTTVVVGDLPPRARLLILGEAPGADEDRMGRPFVGRSGKLLDALLSEAGIERRHVAVLNTIKCRPPGNRVPTRTETAHCRPWTQGQLDLLEPRITVTLGLSATRWMLAAATLSAVRGRVHDVNGRKVLPTYHPAAALRSGPAGEPMQLLREDLARAVELCA
ncbi:MAG: phage polymerase-related protein [Frankiales bacterium]|nr:phage polymerase-related protein [Frankiales bacterium]